MSEKTYSRNDLYIYDLPLSILRSLRLLAFDDHLQESDIMVDSALEKEQNKTVGVQENKTIAKSLYCNTCAIDFKSLEDKRDHCKTDFHTFNVKRHLHGLPPVKESDFNILLKGMTGSADQDSSEPESDASETDESQDNCPGNGEADADIYSKQDSYLGTLIEGELSQLSNEKNDDGNISSNASHLNTRSAQIMFASTLLELSDVFALYKVLFTKKSIEIPMATLKQWNEVDDQSMEMSALFMIGGGHFAGAIVSHQRTNITKSSKKNGESLQEQAVIFLEHKTFHRYTTRRKQGGSQSAMDQAKGKANSAGSSLRRYNEAALKLDVQKLLIEWEPYLKKCQNIFLRAHNTSERKIFTDNDVIQKELEKIKSFPFTTGRPTISELKRCFCELTYLKKLKKPTPITEKETNSHSRKLSKQNSGANKDLAKPKSTEEKHTHELLTLLKKGRAPLLSAYLRKHKLTPDFTLVPESQYKLTPTMLHYAAQYGLKQMIMILMSVMKCDPCIKNKLGKTAWDLAKDTQVKQAFQIGRYKLGEDFTNWNDSHIGFPLNKEEVDKINKKEQDRQNDELAAAIKQELENSKIKQQTDSSETKKGSGRILGDTQISTVQNINSLTEEQRKRLMREQRARAAEARMQKS